MMSSSGRDREVRSIFIRGIPDDASPPDIRQHFESFGAINDVYIPKSFHSGRHRGFAYVKFDRQDDADAAVDRLTTVEINGVKCPVEWAAGGRKSKSAVPLPDLNIASCCLYILVSSPLRDEAL
ncbi:hypothetical protein BC831DRAFT_467689 [Entophlyctis helioformis]|nr:hypothetical protein BC831DRAFT_467689 [Entophlyctis helioformis]